MIVKPVDSNECLGQVLFYDDKESNLIISADVMDYIKADSQRAEVIIWVYYCLQT